MGEVFANSGENEGNIGTPPPFLQGIFIPGIDTPDAQDGFGLVTPLGGGATSRRYNPYGVLGPISSQENQLYDLSRVPAEGATYNFEGLVGPQGLRGLPGAPGITTVVTVPFNSNFLTALPYTLDSLNDLGTAAGKMLYTSAYTTTVNFVWTNSPVASVKSWNEAAINEDATFHIIAGDAGIYVSVDTGSSWNTYDPNSESYIQVQCADSGGKAVVLGADSRATGSIFVTENYGVAWTEKTVEI